MFLLTEKLKRHRLLSKKFKVHYFDLLWIIGRLYDPANVQQTSSKCIQNTRANTGRLLLYAIIDEPAGCLLDVCWIV